MDIGCDEVSVWILVVLSVWISVVLRLLYGLWLCRGKCMDWLC